MADNIQYSGKLMQAPTANPVGAANTATNAWSAFAGGLAQRRKDNDLMQMAELKRQDAATEARRTADHRFLTLHNQKEQNQATNQHAKNVLDLENRKHLYEAEEEARKVAKAKKNYEATTGLMGQYTDQSVKDFEVSEENMEALYQTHGKHLVTGDVTEAEVRANIAAQVGGWKNQENSRSLMIDPQELKRNVIHGLKAQGMEVNEENIQLGMADAGFTKASADQIEAMKGRVQNVVQLGDFLKPGGKGGLSAEGSSEFIKEQDWVQSQIAEMDISNQPGWFSDNADKESTLEAVNALATTAGVSAPFMMAAIKDQFSQGDVSFSMAEVAANGGADEVGKSIIARAQAMAGGGGNLSGHLGTAAQLNAQSAAHMSSILKAGTYQKHTPKQRLASLSEYLTNQGMKPAEIKKVVKDVEDKAKPEVDKNGKPVPLSNKDSLAKIDQAILDLGKEPTVRRHVGARLPMGGGREQGIMPEYLKRARVAIAQERLENGGGFMQDVGDFMHGGAEQNIEGQATLLARREYSKDYKQEVAAKEAWVKRRKQLQDQHNTLSLVPGAGVLPTVPNPNKPK